MIATARYPPRWNTVTSVSRSWAISRTLVRSSRTSVPESRLTWASHDSPPKVVDSTRAETTPRPVSRTSAANRARLAASAATNAGRSQLTAPYDSRNTIRTSAPATRERSERSTGGGPRAATPAPLAS